MARLLDGRPFPFPGAPAFFNALYNPHNYWSADDRLEIFLSVFEGKRHQRMRAFFWFQVGFHSSHVSWTWHPSMYTDEGAKSGMGTSGVAPEAAPAISIWWEVTLYSHEKQLTYTCVSLGAGALNMARPHAYRN